MHTLITTFEPKILVWIVLVPLVAAIVNGIFGRFASRKLVGAVGVGSIAVSFLLSLWVLFYLAKYDAESASVTYELYQWFSLSVGSSEIPVRVAFLADPLSTIMLLVVTGVGLLIHIYSLEYMQDDEGYARFFAYLNLFTASMLILVLGSSLPVMFVGWEGVGLCSYLLIGFWWKNTEYAAAGKKAFIMNRIGDFGVLLGMFILLSATRSFEFAEIAESRSALTAPLFIARSEIGMTATVACLFIFLGCCGKSAQIPLFTWLPDAMAGPTPVSALIHAATMVTAGVYLCCRMSDVFMVSHVAMATVALVGALTALLAASIALVQNQMKRILAYSTVSQLGFMFAAVGCAAFAAGIFHVFTHAFFKACLFLGAGAVMHAVAAHGDADIRKLGNLKKHLPTVRWTFLISCASIAGIPLFAGWFSKDEVLLGSLASADYFATPLAGVEAEIAFLTQSSEPIPFMVGVEQTFWQSLPFVIFGILVAAATMTAFYMFRMYFLAFEGDRYRSQPQPKWVTGELDDEEAEKSEFEMDTEPGHEELVPVEGGYDPHPHQPGERIAMPLWLLAVGAVVVGFLNLEPLYHLFHADALDKNVWGDWVAGTLASVSGEAATEYGAWAFIGGSVAMLIGIGLAYWLYVAQRRLPVIEPRGIHKVLFNKWYVDEIYDRSIVFLVKGLAIVSATLDKYLVDGILARLTAASVEIGGFVFTRLQNGRVYGYGAVMVLGVVALGWWFTYPQPRLEGEVRADAVSWSAGRGLGYEYRWDADGDHEYECDWEDGCEPAVEHTYDRYDWLTPVARISGPEGDDDIPLPNDDTVRLLAEEIGWGADDAREVPEIRRTERGIVVVRNGATVEIEGAEQEEEEVLLEPGREATVERATITSSATARFALLVQGARGTGTDDEIFLDPDGDPEELSDLGPGWERDPEDPGDPPELFVQNGRVVLRPNGARARVGGSEPQEEVELDAGAVIQIGPTTIRVAAVISATVEIRNAFGNVSSDTEELVIEPRGGSAQQAAVDGTRVRSASLRGSPAAPTAPTGQSPRLLTGGAR